MGDDRLYKTHRQTAFPERAVEKILDFVKKDGCIYYKIRWKDSWESEDYLKPFNAYIKEFWNQVEKQPNEVPFDNYGGIKEDHVPYENNNDLPLDYADNYHKPIAHIKHNIDVIQATCRRKGKPKKLVNHEEKYSSDSNSDRSHTPENLEQNTKNWNRTNSPEKLEEIKSNWKEVNSQEKLEEHKSINWNRTNSPEKLESHRNSLNRSISPEDVNSKRTKDVLRVQIPEHLHLHRSALRKRSAEEYPVMIIPEHPLLKKENSQQIPLHSYDERKHQEKLISLASDGKQQQFSLSQHIHEKPEGNSDDEKCQPHPISPVYNCSTYFNNIPSSADHKTILSSPVCDYRAEPSSSRLFFDCRPLYTPGRSIEHKFNHHNNQANFHINRKIEHSQLLLKVTPSLNGIRSGEHYHDDICKRNPLSPTVKKATKVNINRRTRGPTKGATTGEGGEQRPQCKECFQTFKKRAALERHMMIHRGIKPFQCHFCNQKFRQKHHLQGHIMLHTGERPHPCTLCNKRYRMRHHLLEHERISHKVFR